VASSQTGSFLVCLQGEQVDTALHHLVSEIETQLEAKGYALRVFIDIEGTFDSTSNKSIKEALAKHEIPEALVDWTQKMLMGRDDLTVS